MTSRSLEISLKRSSIDVKPKGVKKSQAGKNRYYIIYMDSSQLLGNKEAISNAHVVQVSEKINEFLKVTVKVKLTDMT